jgi:tetratricopeptide (TPR) repeat protein
VAGRLSDAIGHAGTLLEMSRQVENPALLLQANAGMGEVLFHSSKMGQAMQYLKVGLEHTYPDAIKTITSQNSAVTCAAYCAWIAGLQGNISDMQGYFAQSQALSEAIKNPFAVAIHLALNADAVMCVDDIDGCYDLADQAVEISRKHGFPFWLGTGLVIKGWALGRCGKIEPALAAIDEGIAIFRSTGARIQLPNWYGLKADTLLVANRPQDGLKVANAALKYASQTGDTWFTPRIHAIASKLCLQLDQPEKAAFHQAYVDASVPLNNLADAFVKIRVP